jgi:predicted dehydrogenase
MTGEKRSPKIGRRTFLEQVAGASAVASGALLASQSVLGANDRIRIGLIGAGSRGTEIIKAAMQCQGVEAVAAADVFDWRLQKITKIAPGLKTYTDFRRLLDDKNIDAVLIATPQHQHALNFVPALQAGKDVYQEKTMAFTPDHAKRMRQAHASAKRVVQIGIQSTSSPAFAQVKRLATPEQMGTITLVHTHHYRNAPYGGWKRPIPGDCDPAHVDWAAFQGEATPQPFNSDRVMNWRFYWDYSGGNVFENMVHPVGFWFKALDLKIPQSVTMTGANFLSPLMQPPDTMDVSMRHENLLFTWNSAFGNRHYGETDDVLGGNKGSVLRDKEGRVKFVSEQRNQRGAKSDSTSSAPAPASDSDETLAHMRNFMECVRSRAEPNCSFEIGFRSAVACQMAVKSYREGRTVRWDVSREEIV